MAIASCSHQLGSWPPPTIKAVGFIVLRTLTPRRVGFPCGLRSGMWVIAISLDGVGDGGHGHAHGKARDRDRGHAPVRPEPHGAEATGREPGLPACTYRRRIAEPRGICVGLPVPNDLRDQKRGNQDR